MVARRTFRWRISRRRYCSASRRSKSCCSRHSMRSRIPTWRLRSWRCPKLMSRPTRKRNGQTPGAVCVVHSLDLHRVKAAYQQCGSPCMLSCGGACHESAIAAKARAGYFTVFQIVRRWKRNFHGESGGQESEVNIGRNAGGSGDIKTSAGHAANPRQRDSDASHISARAFRHR